MKNNQTTVRTLLLDQLENEHAHIGFDKAVDGLKLSDTGIRPKGLPHSVWELAEHIRLAQHDIVDFCRNPDYETPAWPDDYWPESPQPEDQQQWDEMIENVHRGQRQMADIIKNEENDLLTPIPHGSGQTLFREAMLIVDHNAYHIGQIVQVRRLLGVWE